MSKKTKHIIAQVSYIIVMSIISLIFLFPLYWMVVSSFKPLNQIFRMPFEWLPTEITLENFQKGFKFVGKVSFLTIYKNTAFNTMMCLIGGLMTSSMAAFAFARVNFKFKGILFMILLATMMLPGQVTMVPTYLIHSNLGLVNTRIILFLGYFWGGGAGAIFLQRQFMLGIPIEMDEAARIDGASTFRIYWNIVLPLCKPVLITMGVGIFNGSWNELMTPLIYIRDLNKQLIGPAVNMFMDTGGMGDRGAVIAMTTLSVAPLLIVFFILQKRIVKGVVTVGLKG